jgi:hypothetical protein
LVEVGPSPWLVALYATLEVGGAAALALLSVRNRD